jgi:CDP-diacylglycerol--glycerol-3-phosphate 3-phosphatidyltransferase
MTTANKITIFRILLIPGFVMLGVYYGESVANGEPQEWLRLGAILVFLAASVSDGFDGYIARRYNQRTKLGAILDPIADKGLLLAGLLTLTFSNWGYHFPLWFPVLVIARDVVIVAGGFGLHYLNGDVQVRPRWSGKIATVFQMIAIGWVMLQLTIVRPLIPVVLAGVFTFISGVQYVRDGILQLQRAEHDLARQDTP